MILTQATARPILATIRRECPLVAPRYDRRRHRIILTAHAIAAATTDTVNRWHITPNPDDAIATARRMQAHLTTHMGAPC